MKRFMVVSALMLVCGCDRLEANADFVSNVHECGRIDVGDGAFFRVSRYSAGVPSDNVDVAQVCGQRGCIPVASASNASGPLFSRSDDGEVVLDYIGGSFVRPLASTVMLSGAERRVEVRVRDGRVPEAESRAFSAAARGQYRPNGYRCGKTYFIEP